MTRLQKKCLVAVAGTHLMLVVILFCSGFIRSRQQVDDTQVLDMIPDTAIDKALQSGVHDATPPPPTPPQPVVQPPTPTPPPPTPEPSKPIQPTEPPKPVEPVTPPEKLQPEDLKPVDHTEPKKPKPHTIDISTKLVVRKTPTETSKNNDEEKAAKEAKRLHDERLRAIKTALNKIEKNASSSTTIEMKGDSSVSYANYGAIVKTVYTEAWTPPETATDDEANVKVSITIARDGRVLDAHIIQKSDDSGVNRTVQDTLDRVSEIRPFPDDSTDKERTYIINFNLKAKRMLG